VILLTSPHNYFSGPVGVILTKKDDVPYNYTWIVG